jgi:hypothetical protein
MLNETHKDYQTYLKNSDGGHGLKSNAVAFGTIAKKHLTDDAKAAMGWIQYEINDWKNAKWSDFKPRWPGWGYILEGFVFTLLWAFALPLIAALQLMEHGNKPEPSGAG